MKALGAHVFAGGFTRGVRKIMTVDRQLEIHEFGRATVESTGVEFLNCDHWKEWPVPDKDVVMLFGNPRCTGFSTMTGSCGAKTHGPWADQTVDIHDLCHYGADNRCRLSFGNLYSKPSAWGGHSLTCCEIRSFSQRAIASCIFSSMRGRLEIHRTENDTSS